MVATSVYSKIRSIVGSKLFFAGVLCIFVLGALWIVFSARYPMAFDENYHYGIIKVYSHQISPFISHAPAGTEKLGDITRYPSYLYHYLLSFPYRLISQFTHVEQTKIIVLRLLNVSFVVVGLLYFRRLLLLSQAGKALTNLTLLFFTLIPNVIFLAAHINYDNLLIPLTAAILYYCLQFILAAQKGRLEGGLFIKITVLNLFTTLVVFTHLPVFFATEVFIVMYAFMCARKQRKPLFKSFASSIRKQAPLAKWIGGILLMIGLVLFVERYGVNELKYHNLIPDCGQVLSSKSCQQYGPWGRDFKLMQQPSSTWSNARYFLQWAGQTMYELFFTINYNYFNKPPLLLPFVTAWVVTVLGALLALFNWQRLKSNIAYLFFGFVVLVYGVSLWQNNLNRFHRVGAPVAIHGRYWMQLLPLVMVLMLLGIKYTFERVSKAVRTKIAPILLLVVLLLFLQGGGISSYIISSDETWYWPSKTVVVANNRARTVLNKLILH
jgi:hypothetical protein